jgi:hypothetical protein
MDDAGAGETAPASVSISPASLVSAGALRSRGAGDDPKAPAPSTTDPVDDPGSAIARRLDLRFDGLQHWETGPLWAFTDANPRSVIAGFTFYVPPGSSLRAVRERWNQKVAEQLEAA